MTSPSGKKKLEPKEVDLQLEAEEAVTDTTDQLHIARTIDDLYVVMEGIQTRLDEIAQLLEKQNILLGEMDAVGKNTYRAVHTFDGKWKAFIAMLTTQKTVPAETATVVEKVDPATNKVVERKSFNIAYILNRLLLGKR